MANVIKHKRGSGSDPVASDLVVGEVAIRTDVGKLFTKMDNGSVAEIAGGGSDIAINTLSSSSGTGGGSATFNGSAFRFTLSAPPSVSAQQLLVSINGVIQKPVPGTGQPSEGFSVDGTDIILGDAPEAGSDFFIITFKSLGVSEPADNSVTSAKIADGAIVNADINASAAIAGSKISPNFGSQNIVTTGSVGIGTTSPTYPLTVLSNTSAEGLAIHGRSSDDIGELAFFENDGTTKLGELQYRQDHLNFRHRVGDIRFATGGTTTRMLIDSSGNVGIGTTSPSGGKLHIAHGNEFGLFTSGPFNFQAKFESTDAEAAIVIEDVNSTTDYNRIGVIGNEMQFIVNNSPALHIDSSQRVGIGTTSPSLPLAVVGANNTTFDHLSTLSLTGTNAFDSGDAGAGISFSGKFDSAGNVTTFAQISGIKGNTATGEFDGHLTFGVRNDAEGVNIERMRITNAGRIGIGTTSPGAELDIFHATDPEIHLSINTHGDAARISGDADGLTLDGRGSSNELRFKTGGSHAMRINSSGDVGIGTSNPASNLHIASSLATIRLEDSDVANGAAYSLITGSSNGNIEFKADPDDVRSSSDIRFNIDGSEALRINSSKVVEHQVGTKARFLRNTGGGNTQAVQFLSGSSQVGQIIFNNSETFYQSNTSDRTLKKNFENWTETILTSFKNLNPQKFNYIHESDADSKHKGYVAQDLADKFPEAYPKDPETDKYGFNPSGMVVYLMKALQEAVARIEALEAN